MNLLKGSAALKIVSLLVALLTYVYISNEIRNKEKANSADASYKLIKLTAKKLPVKVRVEAVLPEGYRILRDQITASPSQLAVIGPEALLEDALEAETAIVDVSEYTKSVTKQVPLESVAGVHLVGPPYLMDVFIPIEKLPEPDKVVETPETESAPELLPEASVSPATA